MFCEKCGTRIEGNGKFCAKCGWQVPQSEQNFQSVPEADSKEQEQRKGFQLPHISLNFGKADGNENNTGEKKPVNKVLIGIVAGAALVVVILLLNISNFINLYYRKGASASKYLEHSLNESFLEEASENLAEIYGSCVSNVDVLHQSGDLDVELGLGDKLLDLAEMGLTASGMDFDLSKLKSFGASFSYNINGDKMTASLGTTLNQSGLLSLNVAGDSGFGEAYLQIPELTSEYVGGEIEKDFLLRTLGLYYIADGNYDMLSELQKALPQESEIESLAKKYGKIITKDLTSVKKRSGDKTLKVDSVSQGCTLLEVTLDEDIVKQITNDLLDAIERDKELNKIAKRLIAVEELELDDEDDVIDGILDLVEDMGDGLERMVRYNEGELIVKVYVNKKGGVCGLETELPYYGQVEFRSVESGSKVGYFLSADGVEISGTGTKSGSKVKVDFNITYGSWDIATVSTKNFDINKIKKGQLKGEFTVTPGSWLISELGDLNEVGLKPKDLKLVINADCSSDSAKCDAEILYKDDLFASVKASYKKKSVSSVSMPENVTDVKDEDDLMDWVDTIDWDKFLVEMDKTALPDEVIVGLEEIVDLFEHGDTDELEWYLYNLF